MYYDEIGRTLGYVNLPETGEQVDRAGRRRVRAVDQARDDLAAARRPHGRRRVCSRGQAQENPFFFTDRLPATAATYKVNRPYAVEEDATTSA